MASLKSEIPTSQLEEKVILKYNEDKGDVDVVEKMMDNYRCKVATRR